MLSQHLLARISSLVLGIALPALLAGTPLTTESKALLTERILSHESAGTPGFEVSVEPDPDEAFVKACQQVVERAGIIWQSHLKLKNSIRVSVVLEPLAVGRALAEGRPRNMTYGFKKAPYEATYYPVALAYHISGDDPSPGIPHIIIKINKNRKNEMFFGDGNPGYKYSLLSAVLHELGHGMGFYCTVSVDGTTGKGQWGVHTYPYIYDRFVVRDKKDAFLDFVNPSLELGQAAISGKVFWKKELGVGAIRTKLYSPPNWDTDSICHLDQSTYGGDVLMKPLLYPGEAPKPVSMVIQMLIDMGW